VDKKSSVTGNRKEELSLSALTDSLRDRIFKKVKNYNPHAILRKLRYVE
jgi:adenine C2-methylase RlmN of 23S rRNA A2503 and tRNA A37